MVRFCSGFLGAVLGSLLLTDNTYAQQESLPPPPPLASQDQPPPPPTPPAAQEGVEVLARGPVHEAFAEPTEVRPQASPLVPKQPPEPIEEMPPDQKPEGENVQWIPGYWGWDADQNDFLWVSGLWRTVPPGQQWVPGNWQQVEGGWHWVAGFWAPAGQEDLQYVPMPPPSVDQGPSVPAPDDNSTYVPGCWVYRQSRFLWRPGFWIAYHPGWVWIPAHYIWTPSGCLFVEGYWDHPFEARGLLFAPVRLAARLLGRQRWAFTPSYVVQPDFLMSALFVNPSAYHYYFGDYFDNRYTQAGFVPWIDYRIGRSAYDPNFNYYRLGFARYGGWERGLRNLYQGRFQGDIARPPRTLTQQQQLIQNITTNRTANAALSRNVNITNMQNVSALAPLAQVHNSRVTGLASLANVRADEAKLPHIVNPVLKLQGVPRDQHMQVLQAASQMHAVAQQRRQVEGRMLSQGNVPVHVTDKPQQAKIQLPRAAQSARPQAEERRFFPPAGPQPGAKPAAPARVAPPPPSPPKHEERPIPQHQPPRPPSPPKQTAPPARTPPAPHPTPPPPRHTAPPPPHQATPPPPPPKREQPPPPPKKEQPPPKKEQPPPPPKNKPPHKKV